MTKLCGHILSVSIGFQKSISWMIQTKSLKAQSLKIGSDFNATSANYQNKVHAFNVISKTARGLSMLDAARR